MNPLLLGAGLAALLAGPPLYTLVHGGQLDGTTAFERWLIVAVPCVIGVSWILKIMRDYEDDWRRKDEERARKAADEARAEAQQQMQSGQSGQFGQSGSAPGGGTPR